MTEMMSCERARELLWPLDRPREKDTAVAEARTHLEGCGACRAFFARDAALTRALGRVRMDSRAPAGLEARVRAAIEAEPAALRPGPGPVRRPLRWLAAAAAILLAAVGVSRLGLGVSSAEASYIADFRTHMDEVAPAGGPDLERAAAFFREQLGVPVTPVAFDAGAASHVRVCLIDDRRVAMVEYELEGHTLAHYRVPVARSARALDLTSVTEDDLCVVRWSDEAFEHVLVSDMDEDRLRRLARERFDAPVAP